MAAKQLRQRQLATAAGWLFARLWNIRRYHEMQTTDIVFYTEFETGCE